MWRRSSFPESDCTGSRSSIWISMKPARPNGSEERQERRPAMRLASTSRGVIVLLFVLVVSIVWGMSPGWAVYDIQKWKVIRFTEHLIKSDYSYSYGLAAADLDGDGDLDLTSSDTRN